VTIPYMSLDTMTRCAEFLSYECKPAGVGKKEFMYGRPVFDPIARNLQVVFKVPCNHSPTAKRIWVQPVAPDSTTAEDIRYYDFEEEEECILTRGRRPQLLGTPYGSTSCSLSPKDLVYTVHRRVERVQ
jgi:hypothetical protein